MPELSPKTQRITANIPKDLLREAQRVTRSGITETLVEGLHLLKRRRAYDKAMALKGKLRLQVDIEKSRERNPR